MQDPVPMVRGYCLFKLDEYYYSLEYIADIIMVEKFLARNRALPRRWSCSGHPSCCSSTTRFFPNEAQRSPLLLVLARLPQPSSHRGVHHANQGRTEGQDGGCCSRHCSLTLCSLLDEGLSFSELSEPMIAAYRTCPATRRPCAPSIADRLDG